MTACQEEPKLLLPERTKTIEFDYVDQTRRVAADEKELRFFWFWELGSNDDRYLMQRWDDTRSLILDDPIVKEEQRADFWSEYNLFDRHDFV